MRAGRRPGEEGYALLTAVLAMAMLAAISVTLIGTTRVALDGAGADYAHAKLAAADDAGLVLALHQLTLVESERRWAPDGRTHRLRFDGIGLSISIEDEHGKVPLNRIDDAQARALFAAAGVGGDSLDALTDAFLDWRDPDGLVRAHGAEAAYYAPLGRAPRNGPLHSLEELLGVRGMTPALLARLRPAVTVSGGQGSGFDERFAQPLAIRVMGGSEVSAIQRERELAGERPALTMTQGESLVARALTIRVEARDGAGGALGRSALVELTGHAELPFVVRQVS